VRGGEVGKKSICDVGWIKKSKKCGRKMLTQEGRYIESPLAAEEKQQRAVL
jgi:hypothetical protein